MLMMEMEMGWRWDGDSRVWDQTSKFWAKLFIANWIYIN